MLQSDRGTTLVKLMKESLCERQPVKVSLVKRSHNNGYCQINSHQLLKKHNVSVRSTINLLYHQRNFI